jgi:hypothetical protein
MTWVVVGVIALIGAIAGMIYYFKDSVEWVDALWEGFKSLISPITELVGWFDTLLEKFDIYNKAKEGLAGITDVISEGAGGVFSMMKSMVGMDDGRGDQAGSGIDNSMSKSIIDVNVAALPGSSAEASKRGYKGVNLRNLEGGVS